MHHLQMMKNRKKDEDEGGILLDETGPGVLLQDAETGALWLIAG